MFPPYTLKAAADLIAADAPRSPASYKGAPHKQDFFFNGHPASSPGHLHRRTRILARLGTDKRLGWPFLLHPDGHVREAALRQLTGPAPSPFHFTVLAHRTNDWVPQVRAAARDALTRLDPVANRGAILAAAPALWARIPLWRRTDDVATLDALLFAPEIVAGIADAMRRSHDPILGQALRAALRRPDLDPLLPDLAQGAVAPHLRAIAIRTLGQGEARWLTGYSYAWVDKRFGIRRRVPVLGKRPLTIATPADRILAIGLADPVASVRAAALDVAIAHGLVDRIDRATLQAMAADAHAPLAWRADYCLRTGAKAD